MFTKAMEVPGAWHITNALGHALVLPSHPLSAEQEITFGVLGTGARETIRGRKTDVMAELLASLQRPLYLLDVRRNGVGGQGSWAPLEFCTLIPARMASSIPYAFLHLPCLAPSVALRRDFAGGEHTSWQEFRRRYREELPEEAVTVARAFVEAAIAANGMAIFLCAEPDVPDFDQRPEANTDGKAGQNSVYCHRFTLARRVADQMKDAYGERKIALQHLDMVDFQVQTQKTGTYVPRIRWL